MAVIKFRYFQMKNQSSGVDVYPCLWTPNHNVSWDGRRNNNTYWLLQEGCPHLAFLACPN